MRAAIQRMEAMTKRHRDHRPERGHFLLREIG